MRQLHQRLSSRQKGKGKEERWGKGRGREREEEGTDGPPVSHVPSTPRARVAAILRPYPTAIATRANQ